MVKEKKIDEELDKILKKFYRSDISKWEAKVELKSLFNREGKQKARECIRYDKNKYRCMPSVEKLVKEFEKRIDLKFK